MAALVLAAAVAPGMALAQLPNSADFFRVEVPVENSSVTARQRAVAGAFEVMLRRVTGQTDVASLAGWSAIRSNPGRYTAGMKYLNRDLDELSLFDKLKTPAYIRRNANGDGGNPGEDKVTTLEVTFDKKSLERLLEEYAWTRWPTSRPKVAVWVLLRQGFREDLLTSSARPGGLLREQDVKRYATTLDYLFSRPGIEYVLPDPSWVEDNGHYLYDVKSGSLDKIAQRYALLGYSEFVVIRLRPSTGSNFAGFTRVKLVSQGDLTQSVWDAYGGTAEDVLADGTANLFRRMVQDYVRDAGSLQDINLQLDVSQVKSLQDYARVVNYLTSMPQNVEVKVLGVSERRVEFLLRSRGVWSDMLRVFTSASIFEIETIKVPELSPFAEDPLPGLDEDEATKGGYGKDSESSATASAGDGDSESAAPRIQPRRLRSKHYLHARLRH